MKKLYLSLIITLSVLLFPNLMYSQQFTEETGIALSGIGQGSVDWGDYDNNGYPDILMTGSLATYNATVIYSNNGNSTFTEQTGIFLPGVIISSLKWADFDNDEDLDILLTGSTSGSTLDALSKIYRNDGGVFTEVASGLPGIYLSSVTIGDQDRDGDLDIFMTGMQTTGERISAIYNNNGNLTFSLQTGNNFIKVCYGSTSFGDYDNDGYLDLFISGQTATINRISKIYHNNGNGSFTELTGTPLLGVIYSSGAWADFNNDGFLDLLISGEDAGFTQIARIYLNNTNGNFTAVPGTTLTGTKKGSVACADYDNDGDIDIFITGDRNNTPISKVFTNNGNGSFSENTSISLIGLKESSFGLSDYDRDGDIDLLLTGFDKPGNVYSKIYKNNALVANNLPVKPINLHYTINKTTATLEWDKVAGDETASNSLSYNVRVGLSATGSELVTPHADNTGKRKITSFGNAQLTNKFIFKNLRWNTTYFSSVQALDNSFSGGEFSSAISFSITPAQPTKLTGSNLSTTSILLKWKRGNGDRCILFAKEGNSGPSVPVNNTTYFANSNFGDGSTIGATGWYCIYKGDADSVQLTGLTPEKDYTIHAIEFQGTTGNETYATAINPNNDNIGVFSPGIFTILSGNTMPGLRYSFVAWGDYDNDGFLDILLTGRDISGTGISKVFHNNGDNTFTDQTSIVLPGVENGSSAWGDYNNDNLLDIILTGYNPALGNISRVYKNNGNNTFSEQTNIVLPGVTYSSVTWTDYDNDSDLDLLITGENQSSVFISKIYRNEGSNSFSEQSGIQLPGVKQSSVAMGDYDNDGFLDILLSGLNSSNQNISKIYRNNGNNTFSELTGISLQGVSFSSVAWGDFDNDNNLDILITGATGYNPNYYPVTKIYRNNGNSTFSELSTPSVIGINNGSAEWGDYNNDGLLDILLIGDSGLNFDFKIYLNNGNNGFQELTSLNLPGGIACSSSSADYDNDGDLDILFSGYSGALLSQIYRNNLYMMAGQVKPNMRPEAPTGLKSEVAPRILKLTWAGINTDETFYVNMSYNIRCRLQDDPIWKVAPQSTSAGYRSLNDLGNAQLNRSFTIKDPVSGKYYWQVQAVDQSYSGSEWSKIDSVIIKNTQAYFKTDTVCLGLTTKFTDQSIVTDGIASWKWDFRDGTTSVVQNPVHTYVAAGTYNVKLLVTSTTGTKDSLIQNVIVKAKPAAAFTAPNVCIGTATPLTNTTALNGLTASAWTWTFGDGQTAASQNPGTHTYALSGTYKAKLKTVTSNGCSDSIIKDVIVAKYPESSISVLGDFQTTVDGKLTFCDGLSLQLDAKADPLYVYQWRKDDTDLSGAESKSYVVNRNSGIYNARVTNTLANCVTITEAKAIDIKPSPSKPSITSDNYKTGDCIGIAPIKLKVSQPVNDYKYGWSRYGTPIDNSSSSFIENFLEEGDYTVTAELSGCKASSEKFSVIYQGAPEKPKIFAQGPNKWYLATNTLDAKEYRWYFNERLLDGALKYYYVADQKLGVYRVSVGNENGCFTRSDSLRIPTLKYSPETKSITTGDPFADIKIYPNPTSGMFNIEMDNKVFGELVIDIFTQKGKKSLNIIFEKSTDHFSSQIDLSGQSQGIYIINLQLDKYSTSRKIVVE
ncbi:MAG: VCBS repeat-containing protein [Bacteroidales bacterium]|nr:VCBS repeat-containing protein [Bacteroidales bacterium]